MDYEKKYKALLEQAKEELKTCGSLDCDAAKQIFRLFPELRESEDERIRKELLEHCINRRDGKQICVDASDYRRWAAWLEKQGENPAVSDDANRKEMLCKITQDQTEDWLKKYIDAGKQYEQKDPCKNCSHPKLNCSNFPCIEKKAFDLGKSVFECVKTEYEQAEPKFKVGDWVASARGTARIIGIGGADKTALRSANSSYTRHYERENRKTT